MAIQDMSAADLAAVMNGDNDGFGGNNGWWIILLFILLGGWGNNGWGNRSGAGNVGGNELYPWMEMQQTLCNGFANAETSATNRQMAAQQQMFDLSSRFANCCCENRLGIANLGADIAREACADRAAVSDGIRDILANQSASVQRILDQMCQDKIDAKNEQIAQLRQEIALKDLAASQSLQTAQIVADNAAQTQALEQYLAPVPRPAYVVANPNCCQQWQSCGCGM